MIRLLLPAILLLAPAAVAAQTKPAKPTAKPAAKPAVKPAAKPKLAVPKVPMPPDRAEKLGFGVLQVAAPDSTRFINAWRMGFASKDMVTSTVANQPIFTFLIFHGCKANGVGMCDVVADFVITRPDGSINDENKAVVIWSKAAPVDPKKPYLGDGALGYGVDDEGPFGEYRIVATVTDRVAGVSVTTEQTLTISPAIKPGGPAPVTPDK